VQDAVFGEHDELRAGVAFGVLEQRGGRADELGHPEDRLLALRVRDDLRVGVTLTQLHELLLAEGLVHDAAALPDPHLAAGLLLQPAPEVLVGREEDLAVFGDRADDLLRVRRGADVRRSRPSPRPCS
jgi:hypothetical protein